MTQRNRTGRVGLGLLLGAFLGALGGLGAHVALNRALPPPAATVLYEVLALPAPPTDVSISPNGRESLRSFIENLLDVIRSDRVLDPVARSPDVAGIAWPPKHTDRLGALRAAARAEQIPETNLIRVSVEAPDAHSALALAVVLDRVFREHVELVRTRHARSLIEDLERKVRELQKRVASIDIRLEQAADRERRAIPIEESAEYQERAILTAKLAAARADLAALPAPDEGDAEAGASRRALEALEQRLGARVAELTATIDAIGAERDRIEALTLERAREMEQIRAFQQIIRRVDIQIDRGSRIRVLSPPKLATSSTPPPAWVLVLGGATLFGLLGMALPLVFERGSSGSGRISTD